MNKPCETCETKCKTFEQIDACAKIKKYNDSLERRRKYRRSDTLITSAEQLMQTDWIWWGFKPYHRAFIISMPFVTVMQFIRGKSLYVAELKEKNH